MAKLIDKLMRELNSSAEYKILQDSEYFIIDNVAQMFFKDVPDGGWSLDDFPNLAPPFECFALEYTMPSVALDSEYANPSWKGMKVAGLFLGLNLADLDPITKKELVIRLKKRIPDSVQWFDNVDAKWLMLPIIYVYKDGIANPSDKFIEAMRFMFFLDDTGSVIKNKVGDAFFMTFNSEFGVPSKGVCAALLYPMLLAISLLHCKNVVTEKCPIPVSLDAKYRKKWNKPLIRFKTLIIEPMRTVLRTEGLSEKTGLKKALHICRGHFKDYREGRGLFGKHRGLYYWEQRTRGSHQNGIVDKDYVIKRPK